MGDPPPDPQQPPQQSSSSSQGSERRRSGEPSSVQFTLPPEVPQVVLEPLRSTQEAPASQGWSQGASLSQYEESQGGGAYPAAGFQRQSYLDEDRTQADLMLEQLQQGQGNLFQQLESAFRESQPDAMGQFSAYQREEQQFAEEAQHGPYTRDDPSLQFSPSELGFMPFDMEVSEPEPRELAVQNAKAYLLQTSINCDLSL